MKKVSLAIAIALLCAVLLSGCDFSALPPASTATAGASATAQATPSPLFQPEQLISKQEAEGLVGNKLNEGRQETLPSSGMILMYYGAPTKTDRYLQICLYEVQAYATGTTGDPLSIFKALASTAPQASVAPSHTPQIHQVVEGIGDQAIISPPGIHITYGGYYINISVGDPSDPANQEILKNAGKKAVDNLKQLLGK